MMVVVGMVTQPLLFRVMAALPSLLSPPPRLSSPPPAPITLGGGRSVCALGTGKLRMGSDGVFGSK